MVSATPTMTLRAFFPAVLLMCGALVVPAEVGVAQDDATVELAKRQTVLIGGMNGGLLGSGTIIAPKEILTAFHVVAKHRYVRIQFYGRSDSQRGEVVFHDAYADLALIHVDRFPKYPNASLRTSPVEVGEQLFGIGSAAIAARHTELPLLLTWSVRWGRAIHAPVTVHQVSFIVTDGSSLPGYSGGGLYDLEGNLVGIHKASTAEAVAFAIAADTIKDFLSRAATMTDAKEF